MITLSKSSKIASILRDRIKTGNYAPDDRFSSEQDLAAEFSVARPTVSRALTELVQDGLLVRRPGSGTYVADINGDVDSSVQASKNISLVVWKNTVLMQNLMGRLLQAAEETLQEQGFAFSFACLRPRNGNSNPDIQDFQELVDRRNMAGVLLFADEFTDPQLERLSMTGVPFVWAGYHDSLSPRWNRIRVDVGFGISEAMRYLSERGHRRIALINGESEGTSPANAQKRDAFKKACNNIGVPWQDYYRECFWDSATTNNAIDSLLDLEEPPTAVICVDDYVAGYAIQRIRAKGLSVPEDISIVGFNDLDTAKVLDPALTTLDVHPEEVGKMASKLLLEIIESHHKESTNIVVRPSLIERKSVKALNQ